MDPNETALAEQVGRFEDAVWYRFDPAAHPHGAGGFAPEECARLCVSFARVLARQTDETLALAVRVDLQRRPAFAELFVNRYGSVLALWFARGGSQFHDAQDLAQGLIVQLFEDGLRGYDPTREFRRYLRRIAVNHAVTRARRKRPQFVGYTLERIGPDETALDVAARELDARARSIIEALPRSNRRCSGWR